MLALGAYPGALEIQDSEFQEYDFMRKYMLPSWQ